MAEQKSRDQNVQSCSESCKAVTALETRVEETVVAHQQHEDETDERIHDDSDDNEDEEEEDEVDVADLIEQNHLEMVTNLDLERQFMFSYLRSKSILDEEDCERIINTGNTRQQKASIFLDVIKRKGSNGMKHFIDALGYEYPELYKKITGNEAASRVMTLPSSLSLSWTRLAGRNYNDFDRMILSKQLEQTMSDLHRVTKLHQKLQEEKSMVDKRLFEVENTNHLHLEHIEELKQLIEKISGIKKMSEEYSSMSNNEALAHAHCLELAAQRELVKKTYMIIALQGKLLAQTEEIENIKKDSMAEKRKNGALAKELMGLSVMFDQERRNSKRLNEQVKNQSSDDKFHRNKCKETRDLQLQLACSREENERILTELEDFRKYSEVLNAKFNIVSQEKTELTEHNEMVAYSYQDAQERIKELCIICTSLQCDKDYLAKTNERLMSDVIMYREIQKSFHDELERIRTDSDDAWRSMEKANEELLKQKRVHDEAIHCQMLINRTLEQKYSDLGEELDVMRECLSQTKDELVATKKQIGESAIRRVSNDSITESQISSPPTSPAPSPKVPGDQQETSDTPFYGRRSNKDLLESIKRKVSESDGKFSSVQTRSKNNYSCLNYEQMSMLFSEPHSMTPENVVKTYPRCRSPGIPNSEVKEDAYSLLVSQLLSTENSESHSMQTWPRNDVKDLKVKYERGQSVSPSMSQKNVEFNTQTSRSSSESAKNKRQSFTENKCSSSLNSASVFSSVSSPNSMDEQTRNPNPASPSSYVQSALLSPRFDHPPSYLHSTCLKKKIRSESSPSILRTATLSSASIFLKSIGMNCADSNAMSLDQNNDKSFRSRSSLVNAEHKSSWERRRSLSAPSTPLHVISVSDIISNI